MRQKLFGALKLYLTGISYLDHRLNLTVLLKFKCEMLYHIHRNFRSKMYV